MKTLLIDVRAEDEVFDDFVAAWEGDGTASVFRISFTSWDLLHRVLTPNRVAIIRAMTGAGPLSMREVARRVDRDFKGVHTDVTALLQNGLIDRAADGQIEFPYDKFQLQYDSLATSAA